MDVTTETRVHKKHRSRKKQLYTQILHQMEFYFSDSNLTKDRYLSQQIKGNPVVPLEIFLHFNKIRKLTSNVDDIRKALRVSNMIALSDDESGISRKSPIKQKENVDDCTIYVEKLQSNINHEVLSQIFSEFGTVVYVSLPKYKNSGTTKGFGFVEFNTQDEADNCLNYFDKLGLRMAMVNTPPEQLQSIASFEEPSCKRSKLDHVSDTDEDAEKQKKKKHKKRKMFIKDMGLQVLSKKEWKKIRNLYLDSQRKQMRDVKQYLQKLKAKPMEEDACKTIAPLEFTPNVILKVALQKPCLDLKSFKGQVKEIVPQVQFVDLSSDHLHMYVRFLNAEIATSETCKLEHWGTTTLLIGDEEQSYWGKLQMDRKHKFDKQGNKNRGRDKLLKKVNKHIQFND